MRLSVMHLPFLSRLSLANLVLNSRSVTYGLLLASAICFEFWLRDISAGYVGCADLRIAVRCAG